MNVNSSDIIKKIKEKFNKIKIFSNLNLKSSVSGCLVLFFQKSKNNLNSLITSDYKVVSVIKINSKELHQTKSLVKYFKRNFYQSNSSFSNRNQLRSMNIKSFFIENFTLKPGKSICFLQSENNIIPGYTDLSLGLIFRKSCKITEIRKIKVGFLTEKDNLILFQDFTDLLWTLNFWKKFIKLHSVLIPIQFIIKTLKRIIVKNSTINSLCYGSNLTVNGILAIEENIQKGENVLILTQRKEIVAIGETTFNSKIIIKNSKGNCVILKSILMKKNLYPKKWRLGSYSALKHISNSVKTVHVFN